jgi:hypothetical protein
MGDTAITFVGIVLIWLICYLLVPLVPKEEHREEE